MKIHKSWSFLGLFEKWSSKVLVVVYMWTEKRRSGVIKQMSFQSNRLFKEHFPYLSLLQNALRGWMHYVGTEKEWVE